VKGLAGVGSQLMKKPRYLAGLLIICFPSPVELVTFCFRLSPLPIASCNFQTNAVSLIMASYEFDHSTP
jgi:hypothetical protein